MSAQSSATPGQPAQPESADVDLPRQGLASNAGAATENETPNPDQMGRKQKQCPFVKNQYNRSLWFKTTGTYRGCKCVRGTKKKYTGSFNSWARCEWKASGSCTQSPTSNKCEFGQVSRY